jgi:hypothetical protein
MVRFISLGGVYTEWQMTDCVLFTDFMVAKRDHAFG